MPATEVALSVRGLAVSNDGSVLISDANTGRIRTVGRDGIIRTLPITNTSGGYGITGTGIATLPDGSLVGAGASVVQRARPALPGIGAAGALIVASSDGKEVYTFDPAGRHLQTIDARTASVKTSFAYDSSGLLSEIADANANVTIIERDLTGTPTAIVGPYGHRTELSLDANGYLAALSDPLGGQVAAGYSPGGLMMSFTNARGQNASMSYDTDGRLQTDTDTAGGTKTLNRVTTSSGFNVAKSTSLGRTTTYQVATLASGENAHTNIFPDGSSSSAVFDDLGNVSQVAPDGTTTTTTTRPDPRFGAASPIESQVIQTPAGLVMSVQRSRSVTLADDDDPLSVETISDRVNVNGRSFTTTYNASTRTSVHRTHVGRQFTTRYDEQGRVIETTPSGLTGTSLSYDSRGRLSTVTQGSRTQTHAYFANGAANGFLQSITDALSQTTTYGRDARGRELLETAPDGALTAFDWDADSNLTGVTPPSRPRHAMAYSPVNLLTTYDPPVLASLANPETIYEYDLDRNLTIETRPDGAVLSYAYDTAGRLATITTPDGVVTNTYFAPTPCIGCSPGKRQQVTSTDGVALDFTYDGPLLTSTTWSGPVEGSVQWTHDDDFLPIAEDVVTASGTSTQVFDHDNDGLLRCASSTNCLPPAADALSVTHHPINGLLTQVRLGSITENFGYTSFGELATQTATFSGSALFSEVYDTAAARRDALGRITRKSETLQGTTTVFDYSYDDRGRLEYVNENGSFAVEYTYDANGNRTSATTPSGTVTATYDDQDRLLAYGTLTFAYGANGELETKTDTSTGAITEYDYDVFGNLKRVDLPNGDVIEYVVDGQNRRVAKRRNGALVQQWLYRNQLNPIAELDGAGNLVARFVYGTRHTPEYVIRNGTAYRILNDQLGSPRLVVDAATGAVAQRVRHDAFGNVVEDSNPGFVPFGFAGGLYDAETGLMRFGARDYDALVGRWVSKDPVRFAGLQENLYIYAQNDPLNLVDPSGNVPFWSQEHFRAWTSGQLDRLSRGAQKGAQLAGELTEAGFGPVCRGVISGRCHQFCTRLYKDPRAALACATACSGLAGMCPPWPDDKKECPYPDDAI